jgi:tungstate transport system permease protein
MNYLFNGILQAVKLLLHGDADTYSAIFTTIKVSTSSIFISLLIGIPLGYKFGIKNFCGKKIIKLLVNTMLSLPTVVIGLLVYLLVSNNGPLGNLNLLFTIYAIIIGQTILALPIIIALTGNIIENINKNLLLNLMTLGANGKQIAKTILWETRYALLIVALTAYGRVVSEVGISMMVGGNIRWYTRTITTAIALETGKGEFAMGIALGMVLIVFALLVNITIMLFREKFS